MKIPLRDIYWRTFLHNKNLWQLTSYFMIRMKQLLRNYVMNIFLNCRKIFASCQMADKHLQYYQVLLLLRSRSSKLSARPGKQHSGIWLEFLFVHPDHLHDHNYDKQHQIIVVDFLAFREGYETGNSKKHLYFDDWLPQYCCCCC